MEDLLTGLEDRTGIAEGLLRSLADCPCDGRLDVASAVLVCGEGGEIPAIHAAIRGGIEDCFSGDNGSRFASVRKAAESLRFCHSQCTSRNKCSIALGLHRWSVAARAHHVHGRPHPSPVFPADDATVLSWRGASIVASMPFLQRELITQRKLDEGFTWKDPIVGL